MKTVHVKFTSPTSNAWQNKEYEYYLLPDQTAEAGDYAVVDSPYNGMALVKVTSVTLEGKATKPVVDVVNVTAYNEWIEKEKRRKAIISELEKMAKKIEEKNKYSWLAGLSSEAADLLDELKKL